MHFPTSDILQATWTQKRSREMGKFIKRPVVVEAEQWWPRSHANRKGTVTGVIEGDNGESAFINTLEGLLHVSPGDWIITGVKGERYPCKPDIFEATYRPYIEPNLEGRLGPRLIDQLRSQDTLQPSDPRSIAANAFIKDKAT